MEGNEEHFELKGKDAVGRGVFTDKGFLVRAGSLARREIVPSAQSSVPQVHRRLVADGILEDFDAEQWRFVKDYMFESPSGAAAAILGRTANGWKEWRRADGTTLSKAKRVARDDDAPLLDASKRTQILDRYQQLLNDASLASQQQLDRELNLFRERFGRAALAGLDGERLLALMHDHTNRDSLVYWLEFKNDDEFGTSKFGSIAGGSALKFRIFRRKETGNWQTGSEKGNQPKDITKEEAIEIARTHRDQLLRGIELLDALSPEATDEDYAELQDQMDELAPDVSRLGWGHKYFSLLFASKLDNFHLPDLQRFHLLKLLQLPPDGRGRYICAGRFVAAAREVGLSLNHFTRVIGSLHGRMHRYWRIGTTSGKTGTSYWSMMHDRRCVAIGWQALGDISWVEANKQSREKLKSLLTEKCPNHQTAIGRDCAQLIHFVAEMAEGDVVLAANGMTILGIGRVAGGYEFHQEFPFPHQRSVEWISVEEWQLPESSEGLQSTVRALGKSDENLLAIEQRIQNTSATTPNHKVRSSASNRTERLTGIPGRIQSILERKGQVILYGPPGTGKTYWAEQSANDLAALSAFGKTFQTLDESEREAVLGHDGDYGLVRICCFHAAYGYEDFLEGYRPRTVEGHVSFELRDGVFKKLCKDAEASPERQFYLVIDEINRGDIPRIFGELLTTLEKDKRGKRIILPVSQEVFSIPRNVFLLGTMNTADRSISLLDVALRRRFGFVELMPDGGVLKDSAVGGVVLNAWLDALNLRIRDHVGRDARNLQIGHSYLMQSGSPLKDLAALRRAIRDDIIPLLEEYCYEDYDALGNILGEQIVDVPSQRIRHELFDDGVEDAFVQALLAPFADISTSSAALTSDESQAEAAQEQEEAES